MTHYPQIILHTGFISVLWEKRPLRKCVTVHFCVCAHAHVCSCGFPSYCSHRASFWVGAWVLSHFYTCYIGPAISAKWTPPTPHPSHPESQPGVLSFMWNKCVFPKQSSACPWHSVWPGAHSLQCFMFCSHGLCSSIFAVCAPLSTLPLTCLKHSSAWAA